MESGFKYMKAGRTDSLRHEAPQKRRPAGLRASAVAIVALVATSIAALPVGQAFAAGQVLELPQVTTPHPRAEETAFAPPPERAPAHREVANAPLPPGIGSVNDYMHQEDREQRAVAPQQTGGMRIDNRAGGSSMAANAMLAGLAIGLLALQIQSARHHRHR